MPSHGESRRPARTQEGQGEIDKTALTQSAHPLSDKRLLLCSDRIGRPVPRRIPYSMLPCTWGPQTREGERVGEWGEKDRDCRTPRQTRGPTDFCCREGSLHHRRALRARYQGTA